MNELKSLLLNLIERIDQGPDGKFRLAGVITHQELQALNALAKVDDAPPGSTGESVLTGGAEEYSVAGRTPKLDHSVNELAEVAAGMRVCMDFGTAMSKATLVVDAVGSRKEEIRVLRLGVPGDQEEVDEVMLISSIFIDEEGSLWFGKAARDRAQLVDSDEIHARVDNIKRWLSEGNLDQIVDDIYNPTATKVIYADLILAYLMFFTWTVNKAADLEEDLSVPHNIPRRFALPCFPSNVSSSVAAALRQMLGEAQVLADTWSDRITSGIPLEDFLATVASLRNEISSYEFIDRSVPEPLGVAGSLLSWQSPVDALVLVVDIGAGTSDFSLYRLVMKADELGVVNSELAVAAQVDGSSLGITEAGNHLDNLLKAFVLRKAGVTSSSSSFRMISYDLERDIRELKETLFSSGAVFISLRSGEAVEVELHEFLGEAGVIRFSQSLRQTVERILSSVHPSWIDRVRRDPRGRITVVLTGGGANLPMVQDLARSSAMVRGSEISLVPSLSFPKWLDSDYPELEDRYPRIAVSLGGARKNLVNSMGMATATAGDIGGHYLESFATRGV